MSGSRSLNNSTSKRVLNLLEPVKLTVWKVMIDSSRVWWKLPELSDRLTMLVTVVKFRVNYGGGNGAGCFEVKVRANTEKFMNVTVERFKKCSDLIREGKVFAENKAKVVSRVGCSERAVLILESCCLSPIRRNSVLVELRVRRLADHSSFLRHVSLSGSVLLCVCVYLCVILCHIFCV